MNTTKQVSERRKHERFPLQKRAFVSSDDPVPISGSLLNISMGGLLFEYTQTNEPALNQRQISISISSRKCTISAIPSETIDDFANPPTSGSIRKRRIKFSAMTGAQVFLLQCYIYENC